MPEPQLRSRLVMMSNYINDIEDNDCNTKNNINNHMMITPAMAVKIIIIEMKRKEENK